MFPEEFMIQQKIGFIGAGQMAQALAKGLLRANLVGGEQIVAFDPVPETAARFASEVGGAKLLAGNAAVAQAAEIVFIAVKPQSFADVASQLGGKLSEKCLIVSILAGVSLNRLTTDLKTKRAIRVMPNTPALVGQGASAYALAAGASVEDGQLVAKLLSAVGMAHEVDERLLDAVTGLSGSGPAFAYLLIEALSDGGVRMGLPRPLATALAAQTLRGAAEMVLQGEHPAVLKDRVTSPGGTTIAGLQALEDRGVRGAMIAAVEAATRRSQELGQ
jgi:pyrroline-5-carboxylate reductase